MRNIFISTKHIGLGFSAVVLQAETKNHHKVSEYQTSTQGRYFQN